MIQSQHIGPFKSQVFSQDGSGQHCTDHGIITCDGDHTWGPDDHVVRWTHDDMPWPCCQLSELLQELQWTTNKCQEFKSCQPFTFASHSHYLVPFHVMIVIVSIIRVNSHVATLDFRNTFQIVSSQRQKGKAKKNSVQTPPSLILMSVTLSPPPSLCAVNS